MFATFRLRTRLPADTLNGLGGVLAQEDESVDGKVKWLTCLAEDAPSIERELRDRPDMYNVSSWERWGD